MKRFFKHIRHSLQLPLKWLSIGMLYQWKWLLHKVGLEAEAKQLEETFWRTAERIDSRKD